MTYIHRRKKSLAKRDGKKCSRCGCALRLPGEPRDGHRTAKVSHEIPKSLGGSNRMENLKLICKVCEKKRHKKPNIILMQEADLIASNCKGYEVMNLAIVGSRTFNNYSLLAQTLFEIFQVERITKIISGGAKGADKLADNFAESNGINFIEYPANWEKHGKQAGFIRNQKIIDNCDIVLAFWDGKSPGTKNTIEQAKKAKKPTFIVYF